MKRFPHIYQAEAIARPDGTVDIMSDGLPTIATTSPPEFDGPEGYWSPETFLVASVADCFILTFRAVAKASRLEWIDLECEAEGKLEKDVKLVRFTAFHIRCKLRIPDTERKEMARLLLEKAEVNCLITNSMNARVDMDTKVEVIKSQ